jgi:Pyruvate/2-oxoacid:ferredoxin oxidoreductase gamma subunit
MPEYQIIVTFVFTHKISKKQEEEGTLIPHSTIVKNVNQLLKDKDYSVEEQGM